MTAVTASDGVNVTAPVAYANGIDPTFAFVRVNGTRFVSTADSTESFYFLGANLWNGMSLGASGPSGNRTRLGLDLDALAAAGITQLRILGASEGPDSEPWRIVPSLQPCPGVYNPDVLDGFDYLISEMGKRRMRATVVLGNEWAWSGGHVQYVRWAQQQPDFDAATVNASACVPVGVDDASQLRAPNITDPHWRSRGFQDIAYPGPGQGDWSQYQQLAGQFYSSPTAQRMWQTNVRFLTGHVNIYTGIMHKDDPTIMAWQLANEPRDGGGVHIFGDWLANASAFVKSLAPRQLVSTGMEGDTSYFSPSQSIIMSQRAASIDYVTAHLWVQNWGVYHPGFDNSSLMNTTIAFAHQYISASAAEASYLNKPLVLEEFGFPRDLGSLSSEAATTRRDMYYASVFDTLLASAQSRGVLAGINFWAFAGSGQPLAQGVPASPRQLCSGEPIPSGSSPASFTAQQPDWGACFGSQYARPRACGADTWWATQSAWPPGQYHGQDTWLGDPPHESQGWYSVYTKDTTMAVIAAYAAAINSTNTCAAAAVRTSLAPAGQSGALACTVHIPQGRVGNLCP